MVKRESGRSMIRRARRRENPTCGINSTTTTRGVIVVEVTEDRSRSGREGGGRDERSGVSFKVVFNGGAGEAGFSHDTTDTGVVKNGDDEALQLHFDGQKWRLLLVVVVGLLLLFDGASSLVGLSSLESGDEGVGERRKVVERNIISSRVVSK